MNKQIKIFTLLSVLVLSACGGSGSSNSNGAPFITIWKTDNSGLSNDDQITITTTTSDQNYTIDWGDGSKDSGVTGGITHTYDAAGTYTVEINGDFSNIYFDTDTNNGDNTDGRKLLTIEQWGDIKWSTMSNAFKYCRNLVINASDAPDLSNVTDVSSMFKYATNFNSDISHWDVSSVTNMSGMFSSAETFNADISQWDVSSVTDMSEMFDMADVFNADISQWDVSSVTNMDQMFSHALAFNQNLSLWDVSSVTDMGWMFYGAKLFNSNIGDWNVSNVTDMGLLFENATSFNQDISLWDVSNVTNMGQMFYGATAFSTSISGWDVSSVRGMSRMFKNATAFDFDISAWDVTSVTSMLYMFENMTLPTAAYDSILQGWSAQALQSGVDFDAGNSQYSSAATSARNVLINTYGWTISDGGEQ